MSRPLLHWLYQPSATNGIRFAADGLDEWEFWSYDRLADLAWRAAGALVGHGVAPGDVVSIIQRSGPDFVATFFGVMLAGAIPSPVAPPMVFQDAARYDQHARELINRSGAMTVVANQDLVDRIRLITEPAEATRVRTIISADKLSADSDLKENRNPADLALVQFTSGSSGNAKGVRVTFEALEANCLAIRDWLRMTPDDPTASWLPVHHDMGLIGCLITPVMNGSDIWLMEPAQFVQSPVRYLRCFGSHGARLTAMPNFGLAYITRRVRSAQLGGLDFSQWRALIMGAERIDPVVLDQFSALLGPHGLTRKSLLPAYGLAEATLAVTGLPLDEEPAALLVTPDSCQLGQEIAVTADPGARPVAGCGYPLKGVTVEIVGEEGDTLPAGRVGEIVARGPSIAGGYLPGEASSGTAFGDGGLKTGDAGFLHDGQLYVLGRLGDSIKLRGRSVFAEDLEARIVSNGVPAHRVVVLLGVHRGEPTAVAIVERCVDEWLPSIAAVLRGMSEGSRALVIDAPRTTIERTSSGKPRRRVLWQRFANGTLPGERREMSS